MNKLKFVSVFLSLAFVSLAQAQNRCAEEMARPENTSYPMINGAKSGAAGNAGSDTDRGSGSPVDIDRSTPSSQGGGFFEGGGGSSYSTDF